MQIDRKDPLSSFLVFVIVLLLNQEITIGKRYKFFPFSSYKLSIFYRNIQEI